MDAMDAILSRRSIRRYTAEAVPDEVIKELLEAAMSAPSANNEQPWHFVVIKERRILDKIPDYHPFSSMLREAPMAIVVCGQPKSETSQRFWVQDCSAATQNILLAAQARGLGTVWLGVFPNEKRIEPTRKLLGIPAQVTPLCVISIGYPAEKKPPAKRYNPKKVHHDQW
jgi:nitroreductase